VAICSGILWALGDFAITAADDWPSNLSKFLVTDCLFPVGTLLLSMLAYPLMQGALIHATGRKRLGQPINVLHAYLSAFRKTGRLIGVWLVTCLLVSAMMISLICLPFALSQHLRWLYILTAVLAVGIPFAIYFSIKWLFVLQTVMLEGRRITQTFPRSSDLVTGNWWRGFGIWVLLTLVPVVAGPPIVILFMFWGRLGGFEAVVFQSVFPALIIAPLSTIAQTTLYFDIRVRRERYSPDIMAGELGPESPEAPAAVRPEHVPQWEAMPPGQPRSLNPLLIVIAVAVLLSALVPPAALLLPDYVDRGDIQVSVKNISTGRECGLGHGSLKTFDFTDFAFVVDFNAFVEAGDQENTIVADVNWWGDGWTRSSAVVQVFAQEGTVDGLLSASSPSLPEHEPANEVATVVEILDAEHILVSPTAGEFPSGSQVVLHLDFGGRLGPCARVFTV
jgi:hypothetical protein